jgi:hypothetical protein
MTQSFRSMILDLAGDDYTGLWEFLWGASAAMPDRDRGELVEQLRADVETLINKGELMAYRGSRFSGEELPIPLRDVPAVLADSKQWDPPHAGSSHVRVLTTELEA